MIFQDNVKGSLADRVPDKHKDLARDKVERGKQFLSEEYLPKDRRDQFIYRGKKVRTFFWLLCIQQLFILPLGYHGMSETRRLPGVCDLAACVYRGVRKTWP